MSCENAFASFLSNKFASLCSKAAYFFQKTLLVYFSNNPGQKLQNNSENCFKDASNLRVDDPSHNILGGVCIYFKQSLPLIRRDYLSTLQEI